jgi:hypothetical protein
MLKEGDERKIETKHAATRQRRKFNGRHTRIILFYVEFCLMDGKFERKE